MSNIDINNLLNKYWNAETTIQEEVTLKEYFSSNAVSEEHKEFAPLFKSFALESSISAPELTWNTPVITKEAKVFSISKSWRAFAAVMVIALAAVFLIKANLKPVESKKATIVNIEDPEEALEYTKMALAMVSKNYRKGANKLSGSMNNVNKINIIK